MIKITGLVKSFGGQVIFDNVSFILNRGEKAGLVGRNGHGKTTLFRIITGEDRPDSGEISIPKDYKTGYLSQNLNFTKNTVIDEVMTGIPGNDEDDKWKGEKILYGLGFSKDDMLQSPEKFSGGYQVRLNLAKVLLSESDLLLLDEPTNFLDIVSIRWLTNFLKQWDREFLLITHDRGFMDNVVSHVIGIHRKKIKKIKGNTGKLYEQILKEEEIYEKTRLNDEKKREETELFIKRFRAKARLAGMVQSRIKDLEKKEKQNKLEQIKTLDFSFNHEPFNAKTVLSVNGLTFSYNKDSSPLIKGLDITVGKNDRICVIGKNGKGKTTLLKLLSGELAPLSGEINFHGNTKTGYYAQINSLKLNESATVEEEIAGSVTDKQTARNICGSMMFQGDMALKKIQVLSGGEKCRVLLGKILAAPANLLLLDEPTNHLDMESTEAFMDAIRDFPGAVIIVTHNETFLHSLGERFIVFQNDKTTVFEGSYKDFLKKVGWENEVQETDKNKNNKNETTSRKDLRKVKAEILSKRSAALNPLEAEISKTEKNIEYLEDKMDVLNNKIIKASEAGEGDQISALSKEIHGIKVKIDDLYNTFEILTDEYDNKKDMFNREMEKPANT